MALISRFDAGLHLGESGAFGSAGTVATANVLKLDKAQPGRMRFDIYMTVAAAGGTNATFVVQGSNNNSDWTTVESSPAVATASLTKNAHFSVAVPPEFAYTYIRVAAVTTGTHTAGKFDAVLDVYQGA
jgi:hypothetical protein